MYIIVKSKVIKLKSKIRAIQDAFKDYNMKKGDVEFGMVFLRCVMRAQGGVKCVLSPLRLVPIAINCSLRAVNTLSVLLGRGSQKSEFLVAYFHQLVILVLTQETNVDLQGLVIKKEIQENTSLGEKINLKLLQYYRY